MKRKWNLIQDQIPHITGDGKGSVVGEGGENGKSKDPKYIQWVYDNSVGETFYIDGWIKTGLYDKLSGVKYGWLVESKEVIPGIVTSHIKENYKLYFTKFKYIFTHNKELLELDDRFKFCHGQGSLIKEIKLYPKSKLVSYITSNKNFTKMHKKRIEYAKTFCDKLDLYGRGFNEIENKEIGLCDYMFSIAIENGIYETDFTEKILDCFATGTVPIYLGAPNIGEYFNEDGIIMLTENFKISDLSEDLYYSKMDAIVDNLERVKNYEIPEDFIYKKYFEKN